MTLLEMSEKVYQADLEQFHKRMRELKAELKVETDPRKIDRLRSRICELNVIVRQTRELMGVTRDYYAPGCHREHKYEAYRFY